MEPAELQDAVVGEESMDIEDHQMAVIVFFRLEVPVFQQEWLGIVHIFVL